MVGILGCYSGNWFVRVFWPEGSSECGALLGSSIIWMEFDDFVLHPMCTLAQT